MLKVDIQFFAHKKGMVVRKTVVTVSRNGLV